MTERLHFQFTEEGPEVPRTKVTCLKNEYNMVRVGHCYFFAIVAAVKDCIYFF